MMKITIFDPALRDNTGAPSINLGDLIIKRSADRVIAELFPGAAITRISTHTVPQPDMLAKALESDANLVAGTNLLSSHVAHYNQWKLFHDPLQHADPPNLEAVLFGVGWWQYQDEPDVATRCFYRRLLSKTGPHSLRDAYSAKYLQGCGIGGVYNTTCPTLWRLHGRPTARSGAAKVCLFTLTDYARSPEDDNLIRTLVRLYPEGLLFFPQGSHDLEYIASLPSFTEFRAHIEVLSHQPESLDDIAGRPTWDYVGTRLHAGIWSLEQGHNALILCVDNRAKEIGRETGLAIVERADMPGIERWHAGNHDGPAVITLPLDAIRHWREKLQDYCETRAAARRNLSGPTPPPVPEGTYLNLGCGGRACAGWVNVDFTQTLPGVICHDLTQPLPFSDGSAKVIYSSHVLEHFSRSGARRFLDECHRVLCPGGILRLAVPDLNLLAASYRQAFSEAQECLGAPGAAGEAELLARHEYAVINLIDQLCRHSPGGEMLRFWARRPLPAADYVVETNGLEVLRSLIALHLYPLQESEETGAAPEGEENGQPQAPSFLQRLKYAFAPGTNPLQPPARRTSPEEGLGRFRTSGEPHLWMYDEVSLTLALRQAGFGNITRKTASESCIPGFAAYHLDTSNDGYTNKPESLFMEAVK